MALNLKTNRNDSRSTPTDYVSVDLTKDEEDAPVDLSCPGRHSRATPPVPMEKENLDEEALASLGIKTKEDLNKYISKLQAELRIEEVNLILLQKIRSSHQKDHKSTHESNGLYAADRQQHCGHQNPTQLQQNKHRPAKMQNGSVVKKGSQSQIQQQARYGASTSANSKGLPQHHSSQPPVRATSANAQASSRQQTSSTFQVNGASHNQQSSQQIQLQEQQRKLLQQQQQAAAALVEQTASRRLAAAKMVVQKNLEKDLLRPPGPRASPFDLSIVPNPSCPQFISLVGLEQAVDRLLMDETPKHEVVPLVAGSKRSTCASCSTDFTPKWVERVGKTGAKVSWCEHCHRMEKKRSAGKLQEEKLNSAFAKATQQEREMEKALAAELESAKQQLDAIILPTAASTAFRGASAIPGARNSPALGPSRATEKQPGKASALQSSSQQTSQKHLQQKPSRSAAQQQQLQGAKSILTPHIHQQPPLDLERLMLYNEKVGVMFKQFPGASDQSSSMFKERSSVKQNVGGGRHAPYGRP